MSLFSKPKHPYWIQHSHLFGDPEYICSECGCKVEFPQPECPGFTRDIFFRHHEASVATSGYVFIRHALIFGDRYPFSYFEADYNILCYAPFKTCGTAATAQYDDIVALAKQVDYFKTHVVYILESSDTTIADAIIENTTVSNQRIEVLNSAQSVTSKQAEKGMSYLSIMLGNYDIIEGALNQ